MHYLLCLLLLTAIGASAQMPRNQSGLFEYSHKVTVDDAALAKLLEDKAARFFNQPFLVHWDTIYRHPGTDNLVMKAKGWVDVRAKLRNVAAPRNIPVSLEFTLEVEEKGYKYTWNHFEVDRLEEGIRFEFEKKPDSLKQITYDQLLQKTHERISYVTGYLKRFMKGEE
jgi:hypothetical protein